ncbi:ATP-binding protein [Campylobacter cuniculorum]|uniref:Transformation system protein n=2 Tax=Campylobacter cuniculorum TaxID=374106 RepID=A0A1W6BUG6_9BACT|nr:ATP-binding protein [Campylobacter cuniculorum]ARJ55732.1 transformation system protein [Campylobacter cuniculorum DSM 23162 = LMG 24588]QOR04953.1 ATP-binding protein [Campylobacter cuniculorum]
MSEFVSIQSQERVLSRIKELLKQKSFILLLGQSGSGKTALLRQLCKEFKALHKTQIFKNQKEFQNFIEPVLQSESKPIVLLDEVGMYDERTLESIRIYSDDLSFVLSSHKKPKIFNKEHFKSRFQAEFKLKNLDFGELKDYIKIKHGLDFFPKELKLIYKIYQGNLRNIDKMLKSFKELHSFYKGQKSVKYILNLSAFENALLG